MKSKDTICIAWVHGGVVDTEFALSLMTIVRKNPRVQSYHCVYGTGLLAKSRNILVKHFLDNTKDDWLLMLDADERISEDAFNKLVKTADEDHKVVAGLYFAAVWSGQSLRPVPLIFNQNPETGGVDPWDDYPRDTVTPILAAGTGCLLMHRSVLKKIQETAEPDKGESWCWFQDGPIGGDRWLSEDLSFCARLNQLGIQMYAHTGAVLDHHKDMWLNENNYLAWRSVNQPGTGLEQLR